MKILDLPQRSQEWFEARLGVITGSRAKQVFAKNNLPFIDELIAERLTGVRAGLLGRGRFIPARMVSTSRYSGRGDICIIRVY